MRAGLCLVRLCWIALFAASALAQEPGASAQAARPEIGKPIQAAIELLKSKKGKEALAKVREAQEVGDRTPYENYLVERVLGQAAAAAGEPSIAARAFENVATSSASPEGERRQFFAAAASQYYLIKSYAKAAELAARYFKDGGTEKSVRTIYVQALYLGNDFAGAPRVFRTARHRCGPPQDRDRHDARRGRVPGRRAALAAGRIPDRGGRNHR